MASTRAVELAEALDGVERHRRLAERLVLRIDRLDASEVQERVEQHRGMPDRQHEAVAVRPDRLLGIEAKEALPETVSHWGQSHGRSRVPRVRGLHGVHCQRANSVDRDLIKIVRLAH
jgi:hypothetical protein